MPGKAPSSWGREGSRSAVCNSTASDWAGEGGQTIPFPHNSTNHDAITPSPSPETQSAPDLEKQSNSEAGKKIFHILSAPPMTLTLAVLVRLYRNNIFSKSRHF